MSLRPAGGGEKEVMMEIPGHAQLPARCWEECGMTTIEPNSFQQLDRQPFEP